MGYDAAHVSKQRDGPSLIADLLAHVPQVELPLLDGIDAPVLGRGLAACELELENVAFGNGLERDGAKRGLVEIGLA